MSDSRRQLGNRGEELAAKEYEALGWQVFHRNWHPKGLELRGELDLIVAKGSLLAVVEVKTLRRSGSFGTPRDQVTNAKQRQIKKLTEALLVSFPELRSYFVRFDVAAILWSKGGKPELTIMEDAFR
ncbi:YraN family protein [bacterium]|nr:YraN family protein [bacterium]